MARFRDVFLLTHEARYVGEGRLIEYVLVRIVCVFQVGVQARSTGRLCVHECDNSLVPCQKDEFDWWDKSRWTVISYPPSSPQNQDDVLLYRCSFAMPSPCLTIAGGIANEPATCRAWHLHGARQQLDQCANRGRLGRDP